jgi:phosphate transport system ATP-binding protein
MLKLFKHDIQPVNELTNAQSAVEVKDLNLWFGEKHVLKDITMRIPKNKVTVNLHSSTVLTV